MIRRPGDWLSPVRASGSHPEGHWFESSIAHHPSPSRSCLGVPGKLARFVTRVTNSAGPSSQPQIVAFLTCRSRTPPPRRSPGPPPGLLRAGAERRRPRRALPDISRGNEGHVVAQPNDSGLGTPVDGQISPGCCLTTPRRFGCLRLRGLISGTNDKRAGQAPRRATRRGVRGGGGRPAGSRPGGSSRPRSGRPAGRLPRSGARDRPRP